MYNNLPIAILEEVVPPRVDRGPEVEISGEGVEYNLCFKTCYIKCCHQVIYY